MKKIDRTEEAGIASNGQKMTIITYRNYHDIDVQFEDGTIVTNKTYKCFLKGYIANPNYLTIRSKKSNRIGETYVAINGQKMTIVDYKNNNDIDVKFEDGAIVKNRRYDDFKKGKLINPNYSISNRRIGETNIANNGQKMMIITYRNYHDIDVQFEDGTIVTNKDYQNFVKGTIANPNYKISGRRIGETSMASNGQKMTIIDYRGSDDIDVQFEDSTIVKNKTYGLFKKGKIANPNCITLRKKKSYRIGETSIAINGQKMMIIAYRGSNDMDVQFEDGTIVKNRRYDVFRKGNIRNPNYSMSNRRIGETNIAKNGQKMTIIVYKGSMDVDVRFEDGTIVRNKAYSSFLRGAIANPNFDISKRRVGKINDAQFEDGTIVKNKSYDAFLKGRIKNPNYIVKRKRKPYKNRVGEVHVATNGQKMTIITYRKFNDIDVQFEDDTIVKNKTYDNFLKGNIANPNHRIGEVSIANNGQKMTIIAYRNALDLDIQFEDGTIVKKKHYSHFKKGYIENPNYTIKPGVSYNEIACAFYLKRLGFKKHNAKQLKKYGFGNQELDLFNPNFNGFKVAIEYDGGRHYYQGDNKKNEICKKADIHLIRIREPQLSILKDGLSTNFILKSKKIYSDSLLETLGKVVEYLNAEFGTAYKLKIDRDIDEVQIDELVKAQKHDKHIGEKRQSNYNQTMEIIMYRNCHDIDVQFEDGTIVKHRNYFNFKTGQIIHPNYRKETVTSRTGESIIAANNQLINGYIKNPNCNFINPVNRIGKSVIAYNGQKMTIIAYRKCDDIDVQFEDGTIVKNKAYDSFKRGLIKNPNIKKTV